MNAISNDIHHLVEKELAAANERFPQFHSAHEGYAVILEEYKEAEEELESMQLNIDALFAAIRQNDRAQGIVEIIERTAERLACEAIQVAAMCRKYMDMEADV